MADSEKQKTVHSLLDLMARLRDPDGGCPWDIEQSYATIAPHTIEEAYEVADAIERGDMDDLKDELGDLLFQVVFHTQMAAEDGLFDFYDVADHVTQKMIHRHPHVFGDAVAKTGDDVLHGIWEQQKDKEKKRRDSAGVLDDVTRALPAVMRAQKLQKRAARVGFEWDGVAGAIASLREEMDELCEAVEEKDERHIHEELGDFIFSAVNLGRMLGMDCETSLRDSNAKFERRFKGMESDIESKKQDMKSLTLPEWESLWAAQKAKGL